MPDITVNNNSSGDNFKPTPFPKQGSIAQGGSVSFQAAGNTEITFYAYQIDNSNKVVHAFKETSPYKAPASPSKNTYKLKNNITGAVTLSLTDPASLTQAPMAGVNGTINVGGTGGDPEE